MSLSLTPVTPQPLTITSVCQGDLVANSVTVGSLSMTSPGVLYRDDFNSPYPGFGDPGAFLSFRRSITAPLQFGSSASQVWVLAQGTRGSGAYAVGQSIQMADGLAVATTAPTVSNCVNNGSGLIRVTCTAHGFSTNDWIGVYGVGGTTEANGSWQITRIDANTFDLQGSTFTNAYTSGGHATNRPGMYGIFMTINLKQTRGGLTGTAAAGDDVGGFAVYNGSTTHTLIGGGFFVAGNSTFAGADEFGVAYGLEANVTSAIGLAGNCSQWGIDFNGRAGSNVTYGLGVMKLPNNVGVWADNNTRSAQFEMFRPNTLNETQFFSPVRFNTNINIQGGSLQFWDGLQVFLGTTAGTKFGTATNQRIGFFGATPLPQPSGVGTAAGYTAGATAATFHSDDTYTGNVGTRAFTINGIVAALKNLGLIAST